MAILQLGELTRIIRDYLYDDPFGLTLTEIIHQVNQLKTVPVTPGPIRRSLKELEDLQLIEVDRTSKTHTYSWSPLAAKPADHKVRNPNLKGTPAPMATNAPQTDDEKRKILQEKLKKQMAEITKETQKVQEKEKIPAPKKNAKKGIKRRNGQIYQERDVAGKSDVEMLGLLREKGIFALLSGPPGTGKTVLVDAAFGEAPGGLYVITADENTNVDDFLGQWSPDGKGSFVWVDGPLILAMRSGGVLFVDDATLANPKSLAVLYPAMDGRGEITVKSHIVDNKPEVVRSAPGFYVVAAHNPGVHGAILTDALASRFTAQIWVETDLELAASLGVNEKFLRLTRNLQTKRDKGQLGIWIPQLRELLTARNLSRVFGDEVAAANLLGVAPEDSQDDIAAEMAVVFGKDVEKLQLGSQL
jgi:MoxR-like ATPase